MNRCIRLLPFFIGVLVLGACSQIKGYRIDGSAPLPEFEGKMVYMKDVSTDAPVDSARIINGKFAFADTTKIENPVIKILSIHASKMGLEYRLPVVIENGTIKASIADVVCTEGTMLNERMQDFLLAMVIGGAGTISYLAFNYDALCFCTSSLSYSLMLISE